MTEQKKKRNVSKSQFVLQIQDKGIWNDVPIDAAIMPEPPACAADIRKYVKDAGIEGTFRTIAVKDAFTTTAKTVKKISFE